jgi:hypothetical protein
MTFGIFAIVCPHCGRPLDQESARAGTDGASFVDTGDAAREMLENVAEDVPEDVIVCADCACAFVVRFGYALAVPHSSGAGAA